MDDPKSSIKSVLESVRSFLGQEAPPRLSEADTKANFLEPVIADLGWRGIGQVTREYHVKSSGEFIDYLLSGPNGPLLAIEAKPLQSDLTEKAAAQLVQYCAVEGVEWAALTNMQQLQFFNTFLKGDLAAKRILTVDLLAFNSDAEFDTLFQHLWRLSRESMTSPAGIRNWLNRKRLDSAMRAMLLDQDSGVVRQIRRTLSEKEINVSAAEVVQWIHELLASGPIPSLPIPIVPKGQKPEPGKSSPAESNGAQTEPVGSAAGDKPSFGDGGAGAKPSKGYFGVSIGQLMSAGFVEASATIVLSRSGKDFARATLTSGGEILYNGGIYRSLSDKVFAHLLGIQSLNGWTNWYLESPSGRTMMAEVRNRYLLSKS